MTWELLALAQDVLAVKRGVRVAPASDLVEDLGASTQCVVRLSEGELVTVRFGNSDVRVESQVPAADPSGKAEDAANHDAERNGFNAPQALHVVTGEERLVRHVDKVWVEAGLLAARKSKLFWWESKRIDALYSWFHYARNKLLLFRLWSPRNY